jgi:hypothetical protein
MMKFSIKHGFSLLAGIFLCATVQAESVPIEDRDAFEKRYIECVMSGLKNNCISGLFSKHIAPTVTPEDANQLLVALRTIDDNYRKEGLPVYKVHPVDRVLRADITESRTYIIERSNGLFIGAYVNFVKIKGAWYMGSFGMDGSNKLTEDILKLPVN